MIIDDFDMSLIEDILKGDTTTWEITKKNNPELNQKTPKGLNQLRLKHSCIKSKLKKMERWGIILIKKENNYNEYILIKDRVKIQKHKFPNGYHKALLINPEENGWCIFQL